MSKPIRVLLWSPKGSSEHYHGPGSFAYRLYSLAKPEDAQVTLLHGYSEQPRLELFEQQQYISHGSGILGRVNFLRRSTKWLTDHATDYDVFHGLTAYHSTVQPAHHAHNLGLPAIIFVATHGAELSDKPGIRQLLGWPQKRRRMLSELDGVVSMSRAIYGELVDAGVDPRKIARIPMGVNTDRFRPPTDANERSKLRQELGLRDRPTLLFVGAIIRRKRPHLLVNATRQLIEQGKDLQLVMVGPRDEPEYGNEIAETIEKHNLEEHVKMVGFTPSIEQYHRAADMFALPAWREGMPAALVEAMSSGLACLGTPISGISDLIDDGVTGAIVDPTEESIVAALSRYLEEPSLIMEHGQRSRAQIIDGFGADTVLRAYLQLFRCLMEGSDACDASTLPEVL